MIFDAEAYATDYYENIKPSEHNNHPRLKAWEFIYEYIWDERRTWRDLVLGEQLDTTALHIGFYLANWGMFRGSSGLLQNSNLDLMKAMGKLLFTGRGPDLLELTMDDFLPEAPNLKQNQAHSLTEFRPSRASDSAQTASDVLRLPQTDIRRGIYRFSTD